MIIGTGVDMIEISRIEAALQKERFKEKIFTARELAYAAGRPAESCAGMFAAKEAASKAMGTGFRGFSPLEVEISHDNAGRPYVNPHGAFKKMITEKQVEAIHVSISHCRTYAVACVFLEGGPAVESCFQRSDEKN